MAAPGVTPLITCVVVPPTVPTVRSWVVTTPPTSTAIGNVPVPPTAVLAMVSLVSLVLVKVQIRS